jgi:hypothetical protein
MPNPFYSLHSSRSAQLRELLGFADVAMLCFWTVSQGETS